MFVCILLSFFIMCMRMHETNMLKYIKTKFQQGAWARDSYCVCWQQEENKKARAKKKTEKTLKILSDG
jgi:hypothetical protein